jgi:hypothetical protein
MTAGFEMLRNTALPPGMWKAGDTFLAAYDLRESLSS